MFLTLRLIHEGNLEVSPFYQCSYLHTIVFQGIRGQFFKTCAGANLHLRLPFAPTLAFP
jgi:hypothetical protein